MSCVGVRTGEHTLSFNEITEAIVVEEDADIEWHAVTLLQSANPKETVPGDFSRFKMANFILWPSLVIMPGAKVADLIICLIVMSTVIRHQNMLFVESILMPFVVRGRQVSSCRFCTTIRSRSPETSRPCQHRLQVLLRWVLERIFWF